MTARQWLKERFKDKRSSLILFVVAILFSAYDAITEPLWGIVWLIPTVFIGWIIFQMSSSVLCPFCNRQVALGHTGLSKCVHCDSSFDEQVPMSKMNEEDMQRIGQGKWRQRNKPKEN